MDRTEMECREYLRYALTADMLCIGERMRGSTFRPCVEALPYTTLRGALKERFPRPIRSIHAVGWLTNDAEQPTVNARSILTFSPRDRAREVSVLPLEIEYLSNVAAEVLVCKNDFTVQWPDAFSIRMGAMKSKGFGHCRMHLEETLPRLPPRKGRLKARIPQTEAAMQAFSVTSVPSPNYGYLFQPTTGGTGHYVLSLFEGSLVEADPAILAE